MKSVQGKLSVLAAAGIAAVLTTVALANDDVPSTPTVPSQPVPGDAVKAYPDPWFWPDLHDHNRAVAFGSLLLASGGSNIDQWKEVRPYGYCLASGGDIVIGNPTTGENGSAGRGFDGGAGSNPGSGSSDPGDPVSNCGWSLMVTTAYQFVECPDGRAYITRSGEGVALVSRHEGELYAWSEGVACSDDPFFDAAGIAKGLDQSRPLDLKNLTIQKR